MVAQSDFWEGCFEVLTSFLPSLTYSLSGSFSLFYLISALEKMGVGCRLVVCVYVMYIQIYVYLGDAS